MQENNIINNDDDELDEISVSANAGNYDTPNAFGDGSAKSKKKRKNNATVSTGYKLAKKKKKPVYYGTKDKPNKPLGESKMKTCPQCLNKFELFLHFRSMELVNEIVLLKWHISNFE